MERAGGYGACGARRLVIGVARCWMVARYWMWTLLDLAGCARCICQVLDVDPGILRGVPDAAAWRWMGALASCRVCQMHLPGAGWVLWHLAGCARCICQVLDGCPGILRGVSDASARCWRREAHIHHMQEASTRHVRCILLLKGASSQPHPPPASISPQDASSG